MRQVLFRAKELLRRPPVLVLAGALALGGSALVFVPLFGVPGLELGLALSICVGLLGGGVGIAAVHQERRLAAQAAGGGPQPPSVPGAAPLAWRALAALHGLPLREVRDVPAGRSAARLLELEGDALATSLGRLLGGFELWLRETVL